jgi:hypothetical protein
MLMRELPDKFRTWGASSDNAPRRKEGRSQLTIHFRNVEKTRDEYTKNSVGEKTRGGPAG